MKMKMMMNKYLNSVEREYSFPDSLVPSGGGHCVALNHGSVGCRLD
jgi:hypothetical protein